MELDITGRMERIEIGATGLPAIIQQVQIVCATLVGTVPMDRAFGIEGNSLDRPLPVAKAKASADVIQGIDAYVPRVSVVSVSWVADADAARDGKLTPVVRIRINEP